MNKDKVLMKVGSGFTIKLNKGTENKFPAEIYRAIAMETVEALRRSLEESLDSGECSGGEFIKVTIKATINGEK